MSTTKKILVAIFSIILIGAFVFLITWGVINFEKVKDGLSGTGLYTKEDLDNAYNDGYNTALENKGDYDELLNSYRDTITAQTDTISQLNSEKSTLDKRIADKQSQVDNLTEQKNALQVQIDLLNDVIFDLNSTITDKDGVIDDMAEERQALIEQHTQTVARLNGQILSLNNHIESLNNQIQLDLMTISQLNNKILDLQKDVAFYEGFIAQFETDDKALVTFEFAGSVYSVQVAEKGGKVFVETPQSTELLIFNGWTVDGQAIDLSTYTVIKNVRIVADVTYKYVVSYTVDGVVKSTEIVEKGDYAISPPTVKKTGYTFKYWTLDGENEVHFGQLPITANITFIAKFAKTYKVDFVYENGDKIINTKTVEQGSTIKPPRVTLAENEVLGGWTVNGEYVDFDSYIINGDVTFVAVIINNYTVTFLVDDDIFTVQTVIKGDFVILTDLPLKDGFEFCYWTLDGENEVSLMQYCITADTIFKAKFKSLLTWEAITWNGINYPFNGTSIWSDGVNYYCNLGSPTFGYSIDLQSRTFTNLGSTTLRGSAVWVCGDNVFYSYERTHKKFNKTSGKWEATAWNGLTDTADRTFNGWNVWTDGENTYYSYLNHQYYLDLSSHYWREMEWNGLTSFDGRYIWTDGVSYYYSDGSKQFVLNKSTNTWTEMEWNGLSSFSGYNVWTDGVNIYYSSLEVHYVLDLVTHTWTEKKFNGLNSFLGSCVWTDGVNVYYSNGDLQYILVK